MTERRPSARRVAYDLLLRIDWRGAYANLVLPAALERSGLGDADRAIGPSYLMKPGAAHEMGLDLVWRTQILPLLEDQLYGTGVDIEAEYGLHALRAALEP